MMHGQKFNVNEIDEALLQGLDEEDSEEPKHTRSSLYPSLPPPRPPKPSANPPRSEQSGHVKTTSTTTHGLYPSLSALDEEKPKSLVGKLKAKVTPGKRNSSTKKQSQEIPQEKGHPKKKEDEEVEEDDQVVEELTLEEDPLAQCWFEVFQEVGLPRDACEEYALGFSRFGIDDSNAGTVDDAALQMNGIDNPEHRRIILHLIQALIKHQHESPSATSSQPQVTWDDVEKAQEGLQSEIDKVDKLESRIAKILAGDTDRQREFKARLAKERANREAAREEKRAQHALKRAERVYERVKKDMDL